MTEQPPSPHPVAPWSDRLLRLGLGSLLLLTPLLYSPYLSDYRIPKIALLHAASGLLAGLWLLRGAVVGQLQLRRATFYRPLVVWVAVGLPALALAHNRALAFETWLYYTWFAVLVILFYNHFRPQYISTLLWGLGIIGGAVALLGVLQANQVHIIPRPQPFGNLPVSTLGNTNFVAHFLELVIPLTAVGALIRRPRWQQIALALLAATAAWHLLLAQNRASWLALPVGLGVGFFWVVRRGRRRLVLWLGSLLLLLLAVGLLLAHTPSGGAGSLARRTYNRALSAFDLRNHSVAQRLLIWQNTWALIKAHPLIGVGPGNYSIQLPAYRSPPQHATWHRLKRGQRNRQAFHAHNDYLETWAETGLVGLGALGWLLAAFLVPAWRARGQPTPPWQRLLRGGCMAALVTALVHSCFSFNLRDPTSALYFWTIAALLVSLLNSERDGEPNWRWTLTHPGLRLLVGGAALATATIGCYVGNAFLWGNLNYFQGLVQVQRLQQPNRAILSFRQAAAWRPHAFDYYYMLGKVNLEQQRLDEAAAALHRSLELHPHNAGAWRLLGGTLLTGGNTEGAVAALERATRLNPYGLKGLLLLAQAQRWQGDIQGSLGTLHKARKAFPDNLDLAIDLGLAHMRAESPELAVPLLEEALLVRPHDGLILGNLGTAYMQADRLEEAQEALRQAIGRMPRQLAWRKSLIHLYIRRQRPDLALEQIARSLEMAPEDAELAQLSELVHKQLDKLAE